GGVAQLLADHGQHPLLFGLQLRRRRVPGQLTDQREADQHHGDLYQADQVDPDGDARAARPRVRLGEAHRASTTKRYPTPRTVLSMRGLRGSSPSFFRRWEMCTSMERSKASSALPRTASTSCSRVSTRPARSTNTRSRSNS